MALGAGAWMFVDAGQKNEVIGASRIGRIKLKSIAC